ncbi:siderophore-interacting protein [Streptomyces profundus]|uniref:siderophore-interacting protein n=1 Tax=Streptomyces profundus TaxID=2867410 RepID=UPI001D16E952|nr:siderophore-interacting protein [Streptomyces sp. MA3_2.13]UED86757.1 siderophore-interacting protein [Streptomyces sp. MA3_2.13]
MTAPTLRTHPLVLRRLEVARTATVNARTVRVTLTGEQLDGFRAAGRAQPAFASPAFDDHVKIIFADGGRIEDALPVQLPHGIEWPRAENRLTRDYTPRAVRAEARELDLDFVLGHQGPAAGWARRARPGDAVWIVGPKSSTVLPAGLDWIVLLGDETALPAVARFLEERPTTAPADVYLTIGDPAARVDLPTRPGDRVHWIEDPEHDQGTPLRLIRDHPWREGAGYVWGAGESRALLPVRRHLRNERGLDRARISVTGYWHESAPEPRAGPGGPPGVPELGSATVAWFAVRAALRLSVLDTLAGAGRLPLPELAARAGVAPAGLGPLLAVLAARDIVELTADSVALGTAGAELVNDEHAREGFDGFDAEVLLSLAALDDTLRHGASGWARSHGATAWEAAAQDPEIYGEFVERGEALGFVLDALAAEPAVATAGHIALSGPGAAVVADVLRDRGVTARLTVTGSGTALGVLRPRVRSHGIGFVAGRVPADLAVSALALGPRTDEEAVAALASLRAVADTLLVVESLRPDELGQGAADQGVLRMALTGAPPRSPAAVRALAEAAGWRFDRGVALGWGYEALALTSTRGG